MSFTIETARQKIQNMLPQNKKHHTFVDELWRASLYPADQTQRTEHIILRLMINQKLLWLIDNLMLCISDFMLLAASTVAVSALGQKPFNISWYCPLFLITFWITLQNFLIASHLPCAYPLYQLNAVTAITWSPHVLHVTTNTLSADVFYFLVRNRKWIWSKTFSSSFQFTNWAVAQV